MTTSRWSQVSVRLLLTISGLAHLTAADHPAVVIYGFFVLLFLSPFIGQKVLLKKAWLLTVNALTLGYLLFGLGQLLIIKVAPLNLAIRPHTSHGNARHLQSSRTEPASCGRGCTALHVVELPGRLNRQGSEWRVGLWRGVLRRSSRPSSRSFVTRRS